MRPVTVHTPRLTLSIPVQADAAAITAAAQDPEVPRWTTLPSPYTRSDADEYIVKAARGWEQENELIWAVRDAGAWVGMIGLHAATRDEDAELGYWMAATARGRGLVTEACRAVIDFAFADDGFSLVRISWKAVVSNVASARAARTLGFHYEGTVRQGLISPRGRNDGWLAALLRSDDRMPQPWSVLQD